MTAPVSLPNVYTLIYQNHDSTDLTNIWRNSFDVFSTTVLAPTDPIVDRLGSLVQWMFQSDSISDKVTAYNWGKGTHPYPTDLPLWEKSYAIPGQAQSIFAGVIDMTYTQIGMEVVSRVDHIPATLGKPGRSFFRRLYGLGDVHGTTDGKWVTGVSSASWNSKFQAALTASNLTANFSAGGDAQKVVKVLYSPPPRNVVHGYVVIQAMNYIDPTTNKRTRKAKR